MKLAFALALVLAGCAHGPDRPSLPAGRVAQRLYDLDGEPFSIARFRGKVTLVHVFTTWSEPALLEVPLLDELQRDYPDTLAVVGVALEEDPRTLEIFRDAFDVSYRIGRPDDLARFSGEDGPFGPITTIPTSVLIDDEGRLAARMDGLWSPGTLRKAVRALVEDVAPDPGSQ